MLVSYWFASGFEDHGRFDVLFDREAVLTGNEDSGPWLSGHSVGRVYFVICLLGDSSPSVQSYVWRYVSEGENMTL